MLLVVLVVQSAGGGASGAAVPSPLLPLLPLMLLSPAGAAAAAGLGSASIWRPVLLQPARFPPTPLICPSANQPHHPHLQSKSFYAEDARDEDSYEFDAALGSEEASEFTDLSDGDEEEGADWEQARPPSDRHMYRRSFFPDEEAGGGGVAAAAAAALQGPPLAPFDAADATAAGSGRRHRRHGSGSRGVEASPGAARAVAAAVAAEEAEEEQPTALGRALETLQRPVMILLEVRSQLLALLACAARVGLGWAWTVAGLPAAPGSSLQP